MCNSCGNHDNKHDVKQRMPQLTVSTQCYVYHGWYSFCRYYSQRTCHEIKSTSSHVKQSIKWQQGVTCRSLYLTLYGQTSVCIFSLPLDPCIHFVIKKENLFNRQEQPRRIKQSIGNYMYWKISSKHSIL